MTNKERIDANNAKIEAIQKTLRNKLALINGGVIEIDFPEEFDKVSPVYHTQISKDKIIFGIDKAIGPWLYNIKTKEWKQLHKTTYLVHNVQKVTATKFLIYGYTGIILVFDITTDTVVAQLSIKINDCKIRAINDTKWLIYNSNNSAPVYVYDSSNDNIARILDSGYGFSENHILKLNDYEYLLYSKSSGFVIYNTTTNNCEVIPKDNTNARYWVATIKDRMIFTGTASGIGLTVFNTTSRTIEVVYEPSMSGYTQHMGTFGDKVFIGSTSSSYKGFFVYDYTTNNVTQFASDTTYYKYAHQVSENKIITIGYNKGICYHIDSNSITDLNIKNYPLNASESYRLTATKWLLTGSSYSNSDPGVFIFDTLDDSLVRPHSYGCSWNILQQVSDDVWLIANGNNRFENSSKGLLKLTLSTNKIANIMGYGKFDTITKIDDDNYYVTDNQCGAESRAVTYNVSTNTVKVDKFFFEVK